MQATERLCIMDQNRRPERGGRGPIETVPARKDTELASKVQVYV